MGYTYIYEVINSSQINDLIDLMTDLNSKADTLISLLTDNLSYTILIFFILSIVGGIYIGYLVGRKR